jgi:hypothetical protein
LGGIRRQALAFGGRVVILVGRSEAVRPVVSDDPDELIRAVDTPRAHERESELSPKRVDTA